MSYLLDLHETAAANREVSGGKGANLARLIAAGFPVPGGAVVVARAYREFVRDAAAILAPLVAGDASVDRVERASETARDLLAALPLPPGLEAELRAWVGADGADAYAVRSSGTMEDAAGAAFAGQHDTFLNCVGADAVVARVKSCWLSLWQGRAVAYRAARTGTAADAAMAVVVQRMLPCDAAGVAFTMNPITGSLDDVVVDANAGLGESVVAGASAVDHFVVRKRTGAVVERHVAEKTVRVVRAAQGVAEVAASGPDAWRPAIDDGRLAALARLAVRVEDLFGWPQDLEWGVADGRLWLLQSRPITTVPARWTRDESAERFPTPVTPLTWDFVEPGFHRSLNHSFALMGLAPFAGKWFALFDGYVYGNQTAVELYARRLPADVRSLGDLPSMIPMLRRRFAWLERLPHEWRAALPEYLAAVEAFLAEPLDALDERALWRYVERVSDAGTRYFLPNIAISLGHGILHRAAHALASAASASEKDADSLVAELLACETQTTRVNAELRRLAAIAAADAPFAARLRTTASRTVLAASADGTDGTAFWPAFRAFVREHGHRETDFDAYHPTWIEAPWVVLDHVRTLLDAPPTRAPSDAGDALGRVLRALPEELRDFAAGLVELAREYTAVDDLEHYHTTRLSLPLRRGVRALGERLVARGVLHDPMDLFFARRESIAAAVERLDAGALGALAAEAAAGRAAHFAACAATPEWTRGEADAALPDAGDGAVLSGTAGSPGVAEGTVFVVRGPEDFARFPRGAVLVARTTNPAWTPLFYAAAAVVTESGGALSHGAVTAREMGIPAVMSVRGATAIAEGARVRVDGAAGRVLVLEEAPALAAV